MGTNTSNLNLYKPAAAENNWDAAVNDDLDRIDELAEGWAKPNWTFTYLTTTTFKVTGDVTAYMVNLRKLKINLSVSTVFSSVVSSSFTAGETTITILDAVLDNTLVSVELSTAVIGGNFYLPKSHVTMGADYTITAENVWENTGLSISLPEPGDYLIKASIRARVVANTAIGNAWIKGRFYDATAAAVVTDSDRLIALAYYPHTSLSQVEAQNVTGWEMPYTVTAPTTINLQVTAKKSVTTMSAKVIKSGVEGKSAISYLRVG